MNEKPNHYDGSVQIEKTGNEQTPNEPFILKDEMRVNLSGNPYGYENVE